MTQSKRKLTIQSKSILEKDNHDFVHTINKIDDAA